MRRFRLDARFRCLIAAIILIASLAPSSSLLFPRAYGQVPTVMDHGETSLDWDGLQRKSTWIFLGDSNTYSGGYVALLDAWLTEADPHRPIKLINLGMSSETASGLSEVDHPFKRPCIHERLSKTLAIAQPDVVFICYGMNDGIYQPLNPTNQRAYEAGMLRLAKEIKGCGAKLICLTPPIFEPEPVAAKGNLGPSSSGRYAYFAPAENYDEALVAQSQWCLENVMQADLVIDIHSLLANEKKARVQADPMFAFSNDGVHYGNVAHGLVAEKILQSLNAPQSFISNYPSDATIERSMRRMQLLRDAYLSAGGKNRPGLPAGYPVWYAEQLAK